LPTGKAFDPQNPAQNARKGTEVHQFWETFGQFPLQQKHLQGIWAAAVIASLLLESSLKIFFSVLLGSVRPPVQKEVTS